MAKLTREQINNPWINPTLTQIYLEVARGQSTIPDLMTVINETDATIGKKAKYLAEQGFFKETPLNKKQNQYEINIEKIIEWIITQLNKREYWTVEIYHYNLYSLLQQHENKIPQEYEEKLKYILDEESKKLIHIHELLINLQKIGFRQEILTNKLIKQIIINNIKQTTSITSENTINDVMFSITKKIGSRPNIEISQLYGQTAIKTIVSLSAEIHKTYAYDLENWGVTSRIIIDEVIKNE